MKAPFAILFFVLFIILILGGAFATFRLIKSDQAKEQEKERLIPQLPAQFERVGENRFMGAYTITFEKKTYLVVRDGRGLAIVEHETP